MMKRFKRIPSLVLMGIFAASPALFAERIDGEVQSVNVSSRQLSVARTNVLTGKRETAEIVVPPDADLGSAGVLENVGIGRRVQIDANQNKATGQWEARSVRLI